MVGWWYWFRVEGLGGFRLGSGIAWGVIQCDGRAMVYSPGIPLNQP